MAEFISIKADVKDLEDFFKDFKNDVPYIRKRYLRMLATGGKKFIKKRYLKHLHKDTGKLYKHIKGFLLKNGKEAMIASYAMDGGVRYGFVRAHGATITAKNGEYLTFRIGDKWVKKHSVSQAPNDWIASEGKAYLESNQLRTDTDRFLKKEVDRLQKRYVRK